MPKLRNRKRERFAIEVAAMTPFDRAYVEAGYADSPWARYNASRLANTPEVAARIDELRTEFGKRSQIHAEYLQRKLLPLVEANAADLFEPQADLFKGARLKPITALPRNLAAAIHRIKFDKDTGNLTEVALHSKTEAGSVLLRSVGGFVDRHEFSGKDGQPVEVVPVRPMLPHEVAAAVCDVIAEAEREAGFPPSETKMITRERVDALLSHGLLPPILYEAIHRGKKESP